jgi:tight adherence protein B
MLYGAALLLILAAAFLFVANLRGDMTRRVAARLAAFDAVSHVSGDAFATNARHGSLLHYVSRHVERAGLQVPRARLGLIAGLTLGGALVVGWIWTWSAGILAFLAASFVAFKLLDVAIKRRQERFLSTLPGLLDHMRQSVASGNGVFESLSRALSAGSEISRSYLQPAVMRVRMGANLGEAIQIQAERLGLTEMFILAVILQTHQRFGGSLYESLTNLIEILRAREQARREFIAISSEIRSSAGFLMLLPVFVTVAILLTKPRHFDYFMSGEGQISGAIIIALMLCGAVVIRRLAAVRY